jgi:hypothetical protein
MKRSIYRTFYHVKDLDTPCYECNGLAQIVVEPCEHGGPPLFFAKGKNCWHSTGSSWTVQGAELGALDKGCWRPCIQEGRDDYPPVTPEIMSKALVVIREEQGILIAGTKNA